MRSLACAVPLKEAEAARKWLAARHLIASGLETRREPDRVLFPLTEDPGSLPYPVLEADFEVRTQRATSYAELVQLPPDLHSLLPGGYDIVGDVVLVRLPDELIDHRAPIGDALLRFVPGSRVVVLDRGVHGETRIRSLETIAGSGPLSTTHRENGLSFRVDLAQAYFSPRLAGEHERVAQSGRDGEHLLDLFCGIGPFALTFLVRHPRSAATAVDLNVQAISLARENARRLRVEERLTLAEEDVTGFLAHAGAFDRVVMNLPHEGYKYITLVDPHVKSPGWLHFYGLVPRERSRTTTTVPRLPDEGTAAEALRSLVEPKGQAPKWTLKERREVHPYSPALTLESFTLEKT